MADETLRERLDEKPEELEQALGLKPPYTLREWTEQNAPDQIANFGLRILLKHLTDEKLIQTFMDMVWMVHPIPERAKEVLTCDRPLWFMENPQHPRFVIVMTLSPRRVFIASKDPAVLDRLIQTPPMQLVLRINESMFNNADERVYGRTTLSTATKLFRRAHQNVSGVLRPPFCMVLDL